MKTISAIHAALWLLASLMLFGCGTGQVPYNQAMQVLIQPEHRAFDPGNNTKIAAVVQNDFTGRGVSWSMEGNGCSGAACGTLSAVDNANAVYVPPASTQSGFSVRVRATSIANGLLKADTILSLAEPLAITTTTLPAAGIGSLYQQTLTATGGVQPYLWTIVSGSLPDGMSLDSGSGKISGLPTHIEIASFVVQVADFQGVRATAAFSITVQNVQIAITPSVKQVIEPSQSIVFSAVVTNDPAARGVTWNVAGSTCAAAGCGTLSNTTAFSTTYIAPAHPAAETPITLLATSVDDPGRAAAETLVVAGTLGITTPALVGGRVGQVYADRAIASGGIPPYDFTVVSGSLPPGLSLDPSSGAINGIPTARGNYSFTLQVKDAGGAFAQTARTSLSIAIGDALPLTITTVAIPDATIGQPYAYQLGASGGLAPYQWTLLASTLPAGLSLSTDGIIAGTPTAVGTSSINVQVTDSEASPQHVSKPFTINVVYPHGPHDDALNGRYAFLFNGYYAGLSPVAAAGSFQADGAGNITLGTYDANLNGTMTTTASFSGRYLIGVDNRGQATVQDASGRTLRLSFAVEGAQGHAATVLRLIAFDDGSGASIRGAGTVRLQDTAAFSSASLNGNYAFGVSGQVPHGVNAFGPAAAVGAFSADGSGSLSAGHEDVNLVNVVSPNVGFTGTYLPVDAQNGRTIATLHTNLAANNGLPGTYGLYMIDADEAFLLLLDGHVPAEVLGGELHRQSPAVSGAAALGSTFLIYENGANGDGSNNPVVGQTRAMVAVYSPDGAGNCTLKAMDENAGGVIQTYEQSGLTTSLACPVGANGRVTLGSQEIVSLFAPGSGFVLETGLAALGHVEPQTGGPYSQASVPPTFYFGSIAPASPQANVSVGTGQFEVQSVFAPVEDISTPGTLEPSVSIFLPYVVDSYGRALLPDKQGGNLQGGIYVMYVLSPTKMVWFDENAQNLSPSMEVIEAP